MYAGHAAIALAVRGIRPRIPLALLVPVAFGPDIVEWILEAFNKPERMLSHSLISVGIGATVVALIYWLFSRSKADAFAVWLTYTLHWPADFITGMKPTWPGGPNVGMMLYEHRIADFVVESLLIIVCWGIYRRSLPPERQRSKLSFAIPAGLIVFQAASGIIENPMIKEPLREAMTRLYQ